MDTRVGDEHIRVIPVPTEAGTHFAGQCKAPEALIETGKLIDKLQSVGYTVSVYDYLLSDLEFCAAAPWSPSPKINGCVHWRSLMSEMSLDTHLETASATKPRP